MAAERLAGRNERRCISRDKAGYYGTIVTLGKYSAAEIKADAWSSRITAAVQPLIAKHAALRTVVRDSDTEAPRLVTLETIEAADHVKMLDLVQNGHTVEEVLSDIQKIPLTEYERRPQWKVYIARSLKPQTAYIAFATSHAFLDGRSCVIVHQELLQALHRPLDMPAKTDSKLPLAIENAGSLSISWGFFLSTIAREFLPVWFSTLLGLSVPSRAWFGATERPKPPSTDRPVRTAMKVQWIDGDVLKEVLAACKQHQCRLTSLLNLIFAKSFARALNRRGTEYNQFVTGTPFDLRRCLPERSQEMANYASAANELIEISAEELTARPSHLSTQEWLDIRKSSEALHKAASTLDDQMVGLLRYTGNMKQWVKERAHKPADTSFSISNVGALAQDGAETTDWAIEELMFSQSGDATGAPVNINIASVSGGSMAIVVTWIYGMLGIEQEEELRTTEDRFIQEVCEDVLNRLNHIAGKATTE